MPAGLPPLEVSAEERTQLGRLVRASSTPQQTALRAQIVLAAASGEPSRRIAARLGVSEPTVKLWRRSFADRGLDGLADRPRSGRPRRYDDDQIARVVAQTLEPPPQGETHWSARRLAEATGLSHATVHRIWREHKLRPHQTRSFTYSTDVELEAKVVDLVGLYLDPPAGAFVLCVDEQTQIQALDRTQPRLPIKPGQAARMTHDDKRNGTTSLYAALEVATGHVTGACRPRHTHREFLAFLNPIVRAYPRRPVHVVLDNSSTHTTPEITTWLARHPRVHFHFTPNGASWMNLVEAWFSILTRPQLRRGVHHDVAALIEAITSFITSYNSHPRPFVWTKTADAILTKARPHTQNTSETEH